MVLVVACHLSTWWLTALDVSNVCSNFFTKTRYNQHHTEIDLYHRTKKKKKRESRN